MVCMAFYRESNGKLGTRDLRERRNTGYDGVLSFHSNDIFLL